MDQQMLADLLKEAEQHVAEGERHLEHQRAVVRELERDGHDASQAKTTLAQFEELQGINIANRDRLRREFEAWPG